MGKTLFISNLINAKVTRTRARARAVGKGNREMNDVFLQRVPSGARFIFVIEPPRGSRNRNPDNSVPIKLDCYDTVLGVYFNYLWRFIQL